MNISEVQENVKKNSDKLESKETKDKSILSEEERDKLLARYVSGKPIQKTYDISMGSIELKVTFQLPSSRDEEDGDRAFFKYAKENDILAPMLKSTGSYFGLANHIVEFKDKTAPQFSKDKDGRSANEQKIVWWHKNLMDEPEEIINLLVDKLKHFDQFCLEIFKEDTIENF